MGSLCDNSLFNSLGSIVPNTCSTTGNYTYYKGSCYKVSTTEKRYSEAESDCVADGGHLVSLQDAAENQFVKTTVSVAY